MPDYIPGRTTTASAVPDSELAFIREALNKPSNGRFFSMFPTSTPKYARNAGPRPSERTDSMARFYIEGRGPAIHDENLAASIANLYTGGSRRQNSTEHTGGERDNGAVGYFDFLLGSMSIQFQEREQAVDTLSDNTVVFYSGQSAPMLQGSGAFLNTYQDDQNVWFHYAYMECLRGSRLAMTRQIATLVADSFRFEGYMTSLGVQTQAQVQNAVMFNFTFRVKQISVVTPVLYSATGASEIWRYEQPPLVATQPSAVDDVTPTGAQAAVNAVAARTTAAALAAADAASRDPRAELEAATTPPADAEQQVANTLAEESQLASAAAAVAQGAVSGVVTVAPTASGDVAPAALPPTTNPAAVVPEEQRRLDVASVAASAASGAATSFQRDPASGRVVVNPTTQPVPRSSVIVAASAGAAADRVAAAAQVDAVDGAVYGRSQGSATVANTLPAYAQSSALPSGFTDIYRVSGTVFAEAYARAASQVAVTRTIVGRRSRRRSGARKDAA